MESRARPPFARDGGGVRKNGRTKVGLKVVNQTNAIFLKTLCCVHTNKFLGIKFGWCTKYKHLICVGNICITKISSVDHKKAKHCAAVHQLLEEIGMIF